MERTNLNNQSVVERFTLTHADLTDTDTSQEINLLSLPKGAIVEWVRIKCRTIFAGGSVSALTVSVGSLAGNGTEFASAYSLMAVVADTTFALAANSPNAATYAADRITALFASTTDNLDALTSGVVDIDIKYWAPWRNADDALM